MLLVTRLAALLVSFMWVKKESMLLGLSGWRTKMRSGTSDRLIN